MKLLPSARAFTLALTVDPTCTPRFVSVIKLSLHSLFLVGSASASSVLFTASNQYSHVSHAVFAELDSRAVVSSPVYLVLPSRQGDKPNMSGFAGLEVPCTVCRIFLTDLCSLILLCCCCATFFPPEYSPHSKHSITQRLYHLQPSNLTHLAPVFRKWEMSHLYPSWKKTNH